MVEGLDDGGFALISKTHHAMIDGIAGVDIAQVHVRPRARARRTSRTPTEAWQPAREPSSAEVLAAGTVGPPAGRDPQRDARRGHAARDPQRGARRRARGGRGPRRDRLGGAEPRARHAAERRDRPAPPLRGRAHRPRRLQARQERVRRHGQRRRARRRQRRAARVAALARRARPRASSCARSCRSRSASAGERGALGNRIAAMRGPLPVYIEDPVERLHAVRRTMDGLKESKQAVGAEVLVEHAELRAADDPRPGLAAELLHAPVQPDRDERPRARSSRSTSAAASSRPSSRSRSCPRTTRWRSRSCPTTAR